MSAIVGETLMFGQQQGENIPLVVYGDEFYARYETVDGYTVLYDLKKGCYCYAQLQYEQLVSTGIPVAKQAPVGLRRHIREPARTRNQIFKSRYQLLRAPEPEGETVVMRTLGSNSGLLTGRKVSKGNVRGLTILVEFQDVKSSIKKEDVELMLNGENYNLHGNYGSVRRYYQLMSSGKLDYTNDVVGPVKLSKKQSYYINTPLMQEALDLAIEQHGLDLSRYDSLNQGYVDALSFLYAGRTLYKNWLWPHNSVLGERRQGLNMHYYTIQSMGRSAVDLSIGTFTHETGHMLCRFPDLYDYGQRDGDFEKSAGLGRYCLMSSGNHLNRGKTPSPVCAYLRDLAGWCDKELNLNATAEFRAEHGAYDVVMRYSTDIPNEYYLVENRTGMGLDTYLPDSGLAIYHCDTRGSNEYEDGTPDRHYQCALLQADGVKDLENNFNSGDIGDLFEQKDGVVLDDSTKPASLLWDGSDSGFVVSNVSEAGPVINFSTGNVTTTGDDVVNTITVSSSPDLLIPDNNKTGIISPILVDHHGKLKNISIRVDISHTYQGDLHVSLESPEGTVVVLHANKGGQLDDLHLDMDVETFEGLAALVDESINGEWKLHVKDVAAADVGRLNCWQMEIEYESSTSVVIGEQRAEQVIPDNNSAGIESVITIAESGVVTGLEVQVNIVHSYMGDLQLELVSPADNTIVLQSPNGSEQDNIDKVFTEATTPALSLFHGEEAQGDWRLKVKDIARYDEGVLKHWSLKLNVN